MHLFGWVVYLPERVVKIMNKPLLSGDHNSLHDAEEIKLRPNRLEDFVGQTQFCENLKVFIL